jgi:phage/conjugal plasmid C-4 type zinc finger TraR family protein
MRSGSHAPKLPSELGVIDCQVCGDEIPEARRLAMPGARTCVNCQSALDRGQIFGGINRRGSKDSQLK